MENNDNNSLDREMIQGRDRIIWKLTNVLRDFGIQAKTRKDISNLERTEMMNTVEDFMRVINMYNANIRIVSTDEYEELLEKANKFDKLIERNMDDGR